jgi:hypothetical protein
MMKVIRLDFATVALTALVMSFAGSTQAQGLPTNPMNPSNPTMTSGHLDSDKDALYAQFTNYRRDPNPEQQRFAYPAAKEYLRRFGGEKDDQTKEVQRFVIGYERAMHEREVYDAYNAKNYAKTFELGRAILKTAAKTVEMGGPTSGATVQDFFVFAVLTEAGYDNSLAGNTSLNAETIDYARRAIQLLETGAVSKPDPFKNMDVARGFLNFTLGSLVKDDKPVEAAAAFLKAVQSDSPYRTDPAAYHRLGVTTLKGEFTQLSAEYNEKFGNKPASAEQNAMLERIQHLIERVIDAYARAVALSTKPEQQEAKNKILAQLTALYKNFHNDSDAGLNELISTVLAKPMP